MMNMKGLFNRCFKSCPNPANTKIAKPTKPTAAVPANPASAALTGKGGRYSSRADKIGGSSEQPPPVPSDLYAYPVDNLTDKDILLDWIFINENLDYDFLSDLEKIRHIRNWLLCKLPLAYSDFYDLPYMQVFKLLLLRRRGVICGGSSYIFTKICNENLFKELNISVQY